MNKKVKKEEYIVMKKRTMKLTALMLTTAMTAGLLTGCGSSGEDKKEKEGSRSSDKTINILFQGAKQDGWDAIYEKYLEETKDTLGIELNITWVEQADYKEKLNLTMMGGDEYDLVFDAPWCHLKEMAADEYYADLSEYFNNDEYPGLKAAFSPEVMENNKWYGQMCYIPLMRTYGSGIPAVHYRKDWAKEWGIGTDGQINSMEELTAYWDKAKEHDILPLSVTDARGFYELLSYDRDLAENGIQSWVVGDLVTYVYIKDNKVQAMAVEGSGDEAFKDFPEPYNRDFGVDRFETFAQWQKAGYISQDSMTTKDDLTPFYAGESASVVKILDDTEKIINNFKQYSPEAEYGFFVYAEKARNMQEGAMTTAYTSNNGLCVPASSKKIDTVMKFLDWMFADAANHDLFELGIEGTDWKAVGEDQYESISGYADSFPGYAFTWNPNYVKYSSILPEEVLEYKKWGQLESSFQRAPVCGFNFDTSDVDLSTTIAQVKTVTGKVKTTKLHGILNDGTQEYDSAKDMMKANVDEAMKSGGEDILKALETQLNDYMKENPQQ